MNLNERINVLSKLGEFLEQFGSKKKQTHLKEINEKFYDSFDNAILKVKHTNAFFTVESVESALQGVSKFLEKSILIKWMNKYKIPANTNPKKVGLILAGNIPLVGFHDVLSVLITGNIAKTKFSSKDDKLMLIIRNILIFIHKEFEEKWILVNQKLENFDVVIATGSNNSGRYFDFYFGHYPHIFRNNRNAMAVLDGSETETELSLLADDIFMYFGLGCRNVSKLFVPEKYDFVPLIKAFQKYDYFKNHNKYANNYEYQRTIYHLNKIPHLDSGFFLLKEDIGIASPIAVLYYERYKKMSTVLDRIDLEKNKIQCIVSKNKEIENAVVLGSAQFPEVWDYADNVDTIDFLLNC